jgi:hypothetical protein
MLRTTHVHAEKYTCLYSQCRRYASTRYAQRELRSSDGKIVVLCTFQLSTVVGYGIMETICLVVVHTQETSSTVARMHIKIKVVKKLQTVEIKVLLTIFA